MAERVRRFNIFCAQTHFQLIKSTKMFVIDIFTMWFYGVNLLYQFQFPHSVKLCASLAPLLFQK